MEKFQVKYTVDYQALNPDLTVTFPRFMYYVQETSIRHTDSTVYPMKWYADHQMGWIITNWSIRVAHFPRLNENIVVQTYPTKFKGVVCERGFEVYDEAGRPLLMAFSSWMMTNLAEQKLVKPMPDLIADYGPMFPEPTPKKMGFKFITADGAYELRHKRQFTVTRRDIDTNSHVNNVKYIEWAFDDIPDDLYNNHQPSEVKVVYRKQCRRGDVVQAEFYQDTADPLCAATIIKSPDGADLAEIYSLWTDKEEE
jgi:medium-chain acyl-[acyl-carrier-protein] hydrolase